MATDPDHSATAGSGGGDLLERIVDGSIRLGRAWKALTGERRMAAVAAAVLWLTLFLPWYQASVVSRSPRTRSAVPVGESLSGWAAFGLVQALLLIISVGMLVILFLRAEGRLTHLPGGDGWTVTVAGAFAVFLVIVGLFNAPTPAAHGQYTVSTGLEWGIFLALISAAALTWAGNRIRGSLEDDPFLASNRRAARHEPGDGGDRAGDPKPYSARTERAAEAATSVDPAENATRVDRAENATRVDRAENATRVDRAEDATPVDAAADVTHVAATAPPLTAAAARVASAHPTPVPADPRPAAVEEPEPATEEPQPAAPAAEPATNAAEPPDEEPDRHERPTEPRLPWRPAERPDWTDPERPVGWLTARPGQPPAGDNREP